MAEADHKRCLGCGYILDGLPEPVCPECGRIFDPVSPETDLPTLTRTALRHLLLALISPAVCVVVVWLCLRGRIEGALGLACLNIGLALYVAVRGIDELKKPWYVQPRRLYWQFAVAVSLLFGFSFCGLSALMIWAVSV